MIKLNRVSKTFYKGKRNENRAVRDINLTLPDKGLIVISGPSGSGKTTLLNIIGGLEYTDSGDIFFGDVSVSKGSGKVLDQIRKERIGYIFQHYNLLPQLSVYENIACVLRMIGVRDKVKVDRTVSYVLESVGMQNYKHRKVSALSGGQQQRIGIARAIAKNPDVIIADEPTGNLDSGNTVEVMNMIKRISEQKLVILITHDKQLAEFYGDRIIEIRDGQIRNDSLNEPKGTLDIRHANKIYLKDMDCHSFTAGVVNARLYAETEIDIPKTLNINLIFKNQYLYIQVDAGPELKVRHLDGSSGMEIVDEHNSRLEMAQVAQGGFDLERLNHTGTVARSGSAALSAGEALREGWTRMRGYSKLQKLLLISFVFAAMLIAVSIALIGKLTYAEATEFQQTDKRYLSTDAPIAALLDPRSGIEFINPVVEPLMFEVTMQSFYQLDGVMSMEAHPSDINLLTDKNIVFGRYPEHPSEVLLDRMTAVTLLNETEYKHAGIRTAEDLIGLEIYNGDLERQEPLLVTGISDTDSPTMWMSEGLIYELALNAAVRLTKDKETSSARAQGSAVSIPLSKSWSTRAESKRLALQYEPLRGGKPIWVYAESAEPTIAYLTQLGYEATSTFENSKQRYMEEVRRTYYSLLSFASVLTAISLLQLYFMVRSSLLTRVYEIGVYRALGVSRREIYGLFFYELLLLTTVTSVVGYLLMTLLIKELERILAPVVKLFYFPMPYIIGGLVLIYAVNLLSGLFPVYTLLRKSPSQILKHHDA